MKGIVTFLALTMILPSSGWSQTTETAAERQARLLEAFKETLAADQAPVERVKVAQPVAAAQPAPVSAGDTPAVAIALPAQVPTPKVRPDYVPTANAAPVKKTDVATRQAAIRYNSCTKSLDDFLEAPALLTLIEQKLALSNSFDIFDRVFAGPQEGFLLDISSGRHIEYVELPSQTRRKVTAVCARDVFIDGKVSKRIYFKVASADGVDDSVEITPVTAPQGSKPAYQVLVLKNSFDPAQDYTSQMLSKEDYARIGHSSPRQNQSRLNQQGPSSHRVGGLF